MNYVLATPMKNLLSKPGVSSNCKVLLYLLALRACRPKIMMKMTSIHLDAPSTYQRHGLCISSLSNVHIFTMGRLEKRRGVSSRATDSIFPPKPYRGLSGLESHSKLFRLAIMLWSCQSSPENGSGVVYDKTFSPSCYGGWFDSVVGKATDTGFQSSGPNNEWIGVLD